MYVDAAVDQRRDKFGIGIAAKANEGNLISTWSIPTAAKGEAAIMEAHAIRTALLKALKENWTSILGVTVSQETNSRFKSDLFGNLGLVVEKRTRELRELI
ncbi:uncharacterized protein [Coffea arabica]|uniref:RNase H type-1 domain-containing protein n=1 Tax=Coffea arabica TaxID=13443 RepID=A0ABM4UBB8_COFAR